MKFELNFLNILFFAGILITSCSKNSTEVALEDFDAQTELANLEQELLTVDEWEDSEDEIENGRVLTSEEQFLFPPDCVTRTWEVVAPQVRRLTIDFGTEPCLGNDGLYRRGKIAITYTGPRNEIGSTRKTTFIRYAVMNTELNGTKTIENLGSHTYSRLVDVEHTVGDLTSSYQADQLVEKIAGYLTPVRQDDIFKVTGSGSGVRKNDITYTSEIIDPLIRKLQLGCYENFVDGEVLFTNENEVETLLDYDPIGGAPCDKLASITRNGETRIITLW